MNPVVGLIESLPHWARVAFAARCARCGLPRFRHAWPDAPDRYRGYVETAVTWVERSAKNGRAEEGMKEAVTKAMMTAGAALAPVFGFPSEEPAPGDKTKCLVASFVAKSAEWAARTASAPVEGSANSALEAFGFLRQATEAEGEEDILPVLRSELEALCRVAAQGGWTDSTAVAPEAFTFLADSTPTRPWWRN